MTFLNLLLRCPERFCLSDFFRLRRRGSCLSFSYPHPQPHQKIIQYIQRSFPLGSRRYRALRRQTAVLQTPGRIARRTGHTEKGEAPGPTSAPRRSTLTAGCVRAARESVSPRRDRANAPSESRLSLHAWGQSKHSVQDAHTRTTQTLHQSAGCHCTQGQNTTLSQTHFLPRAQA